MLGLFLMVLILVVEISELAADESCEVNIQKGPQGNFHLKRPCKRNNSECLDIITGQYICEQQCKFYLNGAIGLAIALGLMFVILCLVITGWAFTCWIMHKTTDFSIKPKESICLNRYEETPSENSISFQPMTKYNRLVGPSYENTSDNGLGRLRGEEGEGIYEVLDGEKEETVEPKRSISKNRSAVISGGSTASYNTLKFEDH